MQSFQAFYSANKDKLFAYLMRMTGDYQLACDIMQESFTRFLERYGRQSPKRSLLFAIARNAALDDARKNSRIHAADTNDAEDANDQERRLLVRESCRDVLKALQTLKKNERDILSLVVSSDLSYREVAELTGMSEANVKVTVHRARVKLRQILREVNGYE
jgi:RNA polymerase sigma-70 factor (ECF subfamily)